jgi:hypothetical protein
MIPWRVQTSDKGDFDEMVVGNCAVHLEMMDARTLWMAIYHPNGEDRWAFSVTMDKNGKPKRVTMVEQAH